MCCHICFLGADRVLAEIKCPKYFSRSHDELMVPSIKQHRSSAVYPCLLYTSYLISPKHQDQYGFSGSHLLTIFQAMCVCVCNSVWMTMFTCFTVESSRDQWKHSADRLTHTKALCHYRDQTVQGHRLSLVLLPLKKNAAPVHLQVRLHDQAASM